MAVEEEDAEREEDDEEEDAEREEDDEEEDKADGQTAPAGKEDEDDEEVSTDALFTKLSGGAPVSGPRRLSLRSFSSVPPGAEKLLAVKKLLIFCAVF